MTKSIFRVIALLTALLLSASLLWACNGDAEEETDASETEASTLIESDTETDKAESSSETKKEPVYNKPKDENAAETTKEYISTKQDGKDDIANDIFH